MVETPGPQSPTSAHENVGRAQTLARSVLDEVGRSFVGHQEIPELILTALLARGHCLLEGVPGVAKTPLIQAVAGAIGGAFKRIQFTPDLLPSDITGTYVLSQRDGTFTLRPGPIFAHIVLADEINRTSPKVQSAMLEAMAEKQTTIDNRTRKLDDLFFVIATQNPLDLAGTFPLPSAQLDRFLFKVKMKHIQREAELEILASYKARRDGAGADLPRVTRTEVVESRRAVEQMIYVAPEIRECLVDLANATRSDPRILQGASTRSLVLMLPALQARALSRVRDFVSAEDVEYLAPYIFGHRLELAPGTDSVEAVIRECAAKPMERLARATLRR